MKAVNAFKKSLKVSRFKLFGLTLAIGLVIIFGKIWLIKDDSFPYSSSSTDVKIILREHPSDVDQRSVYLIKFGDIEGEAVLTPAFTKSEGQADIDSQIISITSTFRDSVAPYPGHITSSIRCDSTKYLKEKILSFRGADTKLILAVASGRHIFGVCSSNEIKYASAFWAAYDEQRKLVVTVKLFKPIGDPNKIEESQEEIRSVFNKVIHQ